MHDIKDNDMNNLNQLNMDVFSFERFSSKPIVIMETTVDDINPILECIQMQ